MFGLLVERPDLCWMSSIFSRAGVEEAGTWTVYGPALVRRRSTGISSIVLLQSQ